MNATTTTQPTPVRTLVVEFQAFDEQLGSSLTRYRNSGTPGKQYSYLYTGSRNVRAGDWALVHNGTNFGMTKIQRVKPGIDEKVTKHVITVITQNDFERYMAANKAIVNHREVYDQLDYLLAESKKHDKYRELAEKDPYAKELLDRLNVYNGPTLEHTPPPFSFGDAPVQPTVREELTIPKFVYWSEAGQGFFEQDGVMSGYFCRKWYDRRKEFPQSLEEMKRLSEQA